MNTDYERIEKAIHFITENFRDQPELDKVAEQVHLSPFHFQRMFQDWAGVSPKKFLQFISLEYSKKLLAQKMTVAEASYETGLSGTGRLHDLFVTIEHMTPGEFRNQGKDLFIKYSFASSTFGNVLIASTEKGICHLSFYQDADKALEELLSTFPLAPFENATDENQQQGLNTLSGLSAHPQRLNLHLKASPFQLKVWNALLKVPEGAVTTYGNIAQSIGQPSASRAVGTAIGSNNIAVLIPCHRVIRNSGEKGGYRWGMDRKVALLGWEAARGD